jgi:hypothetical protein
LRLDQTASRPGGRKDKEVHVAQPQPDYSEDDSIVGGIAPIPSLGGALPAGSPPGVVWLTMCAWCGRLKVRDRWVAAPPAPDLIDLSGTRKHPVTHGICPTCFDQTTAKADRQRARRGA